MQAVYTAVMPQLTPYWVSTAVYGWNAMIYIGNIHRHAHKLCIYDAFGCMSFERKVHVLVYGRRKYSCDK